LALAAAATSWLSSVQPMCFSRKINGSKGNNVIHIWFNFYLWKNYRCIEEKQKIEIHEQKYGGKRKQKRIDEKKKKGK
jgi:hypothetical protein